MDGAHVCRCCSSQGLANCQTTVTILVKPWCELHTSVNTCNTVLPIRLDTQEHVQRQVHLNIKDLTVITDLAFQLGGKLLSYTHVHVHEFR